jgi:hypothetical protein
VHGPCSGFVTATGEAGGTTIHGYQSAGHTEGLGVVDTYGLSCLQGWTCGNMVTTPRNVARFFWLLLRPVSRSASPSASARAAHAEGGGVTSQGPLISNASLTQMRAWLPTGLRPGDVTFEYGLGLIELGKGWTGHTGQIIGWEAFAFYNSRTGATVVVMVNETGSGVAGLALIGQIYPDLAQSLL